MRTMSDFLNMSIMREGDNATIIFAWLGPTAVPLLYFVVSASLSDYIIQQAAYFHYLQLQIV